MIIKPTAAITTVLTSLLLLSSTSIAVAAPLNELYPANAQVQAVPAKTRAQVVEELAQSQAAGKARVSEVSNYAYAAPVSYNGSQTAGKTRTEVVAELRQAIHDGTYVGTSELAQYPVIQVASTPRSRADVRAEAVQSAKNGYAVPPALRTN